MRKSFALAAVGITLAASFGGFTASTASANAPCGRAAPPDIDHSAYVTSTVDAKMRSGSSTDCAALWQLSAGDRADYYCYTVNTVGNSWTFLRDVRTNKTGWVRDDLLPGYGSNVYCGF